MGTNATDQSVGRARSVRALRWFLGVPFRRQTYLNLAYLALSVPLGLAYFVLFVLGVSLGIGLAILLVGVVILGVTVLLGLALVSIERVLTNGLLGTDIDGHRALSGDGWLERSKSVALDRRTWTAVLTLPAKFALGIVSLVVLSVGIPTAIGMILVPLYYDRPGVYVGVVSDRAPEIHETIYLGWNYLLVGVETAFTLGYWEIGSLPAALVVGSGGIVLLFGTLHACNGLASLWARYVTWSMDGSVDLLGAILDRSG